MDENMIENLPLSRLRKHNVLGKLIIPRIMTTIEYILAELEEKEREEFFRIKRTQQKKMERIAKKLKAEKENLLTVEEFIPPEPLIKEEPAVAKYESPTETSQLSKPSGDTLETPEENKSVVIDMPKLLETKDDAEYACSLKEIPSAILNETINPDDYCLCGFLEATDDTKAYDIGKCVCSAKRSLQPLKPVIKILEPCTPRSSPVCETPLPESFLKSISFEPCKSIKPSRVSICDPCTTAKLSQEALDIMKSFLLSSAIGSYVKKSKSIIKYVKSVDANGVVRETKEETRVKIEKLNKDNMQITAKRSNTSSIFEECICSKENSSDGSIRLALPEPIPKKESVKDTTSSSKCMKTYSNSYKPVETVFVQSSNQGIIFSDKSGSGICDCSKNSVKSATSTKCYKKPPSSKSSKCDTTNINNQNCRSKDAPVTELLVSNSMLKLLKSFSEYANKPNEKQATAVDIQEKQSKGKLCKKHRVSNEYSTGCTPKSKPSLKSFYEYLMKKSASEQGCKKCLEEKQLQNKPSCTRSINHKESFPKCRKNFVQLLNLNIHKNKKKSVVNEDKKPDSDDSINLTIDIGLKNDIIGCPVSNAQSNISDDSYLSSLSCQKNICECEKETESLFSKTYDVNSCCNKNDYLHYDKINKWRLNRNNISFNIKRKAGNKSWNENDLTKLNETDKESGKTDEIDQIVNKANNHQDKEKKLDDCGCELNSNNKKIDMNNFDTVDSDPPIIPIVSDGKKSSKKIMKISKEFCCKSEEENKLDTITNKGNFQNCRNKYSEKNNNCHNKLDKPIKKNEVGQSNDLDIIYDDSDSIRSDNIESEKKIVNETKEYDCKPDMKQNQMLKSNEKYNQQGDIDNETKTCNCKSNLYSNICKKSTNIFTDDSVPLTSYTPENDKKALNKTEVKSKVKNKIRDNEVTDISTEESRKGPYKTKECGCKLDSNDKIQSDINLGCRKNDICQENTPIEVKCDDLVKDGVNTNDVRIDDDQAEIIFKDTMKKISEKFNHITNYSLKMDKNIEPQKIKSYECPTCDEKLIHKLKTDDEMFCECQENDELLEVKCGTLNYDSFCDCTDSDKLYCDKMYDILTTKSFCICTKQLYEDEPNCLCEEVDEKFNCECTDSDETSVITKKTKYILNNNSPGVNFTYNAKNPVNMLDINSLEHDQVPINMVENNENNSKNNEDDETTKNKVCECIESNENINYEWPFAKLETLSYTIDATIKSYIPQPAVDMLNYAKEVVINSPSRLIVSFQDIRNKKEFTTVNEQNFDETSRINNLTQDNEFNEEHKASTEDFQEIINKTEKIAEKEIIIHEKPNNNAAESTEIVEPLKNKIPTDGEIKGATTQDFETKINGKIKKSVISRETKITGGENQTSNEDNTVEYNLNSNSDLKEKTNDVSTYSYANINQGGNINITSEDPEQKKKPPVKSIDLIFDQTTDSLAPGEQNVTKKEVNLVMHNNDDEIVNIPVIIACENIPKGTVTHTIEIINQETDDFTYNPLEPTIININKKLKVECKKSINNEENNKDMNYCNVCKENPKNKTICKKICYRPDRITLNCQDTEMENGLKNKQNHNQNLTLSEKDDKIKNKTQLGEIFVLKNKEVIVEKSNKIDTHKENNESMLKNTNISKTQNELELNLINQDENDLNLQNAKSIPKNNDNQICEDCNKTDNNSVALKRVSDQDDYKIEKKYFIRMNNPESCCDSQMCKSDIGELEIVTTETDSAYKIQPPEATTKEPIVKIFSESSAQTKRNENRGIQTILCDDSCSDTCKLQKQASNATTELLKGVLSKLDKGKSSKSQSEKTLVFQSPTFISDESDTSCELCKLEKQRAERVSSDESQESRFMSCKVCQYEFNQKLRELLNSEQSNESCSRHRQRSVSDCDCCIEEHQRHTNRSSISRTDSEKHKKTYDY